MLMCLCALVSLVIGASANAQAAPESQPTRWERAWVGGLHALGPVGGSLALGVGLRRPESNPKDRSRLLFAILEPGIGGQRVSLGYAESVGHLAGGWSMRGSLLKLTGEPARRTLLGGELQVLAVLCAGARVGAFRPLGQRERQSTVFLADFSLCL